MAIEAVTLAHHGQPGRNYFLLFISRAPTGSDERAGVHEFSIRRGTAILGVFHPNLVSYRLARREKVACLRRDEPHLWRRISHEQGNCGFGGTAVPIRNLKFNHIIPELRHGKFGAGLG